MQRLIVLNCLLDLISSLRVFKSQCFDCSFFFQLQVKGGQTHNLLRALLRQVSNLVQGAQQIRLLSSFHLKTEGEPTAETLCFKSY